MKKLRFIIISGVIGAAVGAAIFTTNIYLPKIWKVKKVGSIYAYILFGCIVGCGLAYFWIKDREDR